jgi:hypothetical protein
MRGTYYGGALPRAFYDVDIKSGTKTVAKTPKVSPSQIKKAIESRDKAITRMNEEIQSLKVIQRNLENLKKLGSTRTRSTTTRESPL